MTSLNRKLRIHNRTGYTLIELMLYIAILGSLLAAVSGFYAMTQATQKKAQVIAEVDQQGNMVIETITSTLRNASNINSPVAGANSTSASIAMASSSINPTIYDLNGSALRRQEGVAAAELLTSTRIQVSNLTFRNLTRSGTDGALQVSFTLSSTNTSGRAEYAYQKNFITTVALRQ